MSEKIEPLPPVKVTVNWVNHIKRIIIGVIFIILGLLLFAAAINILVYTINNIIHKGFFDPESIKFSIYIVIGSYFCLILDKEKIYQALGIKRDLPFITIEQIEAKSKKKCPK